MEIGSLPLEHRSVGEIVAEDYRRAPVFKRYGIDFCCGGGKTLEAAAANAGVSVDEVVRELAGAVGSRRGHDALRVDHWDPGFLADFIVNQHHRYVREQTPALRAFTEKVARVHGARHPELVEIEGVFARVADDLERHMEREEAEIFPRIKALAAGGPADATLGSAIEELEADHDGAGALMREIRRLSNGFTPPADACNTYRAAYANLEAFEDDLHRHVHLENNVLFPGVLSPAAGQEGVAE